LILSNILQKKKILNDEEVMKNIKEADKSWKDKRGEEFISW